MYILKKQSIKQARNASTPLSPSLRNICAIARKVWITAMISDPKQILPIEVVHARLKLASVGDLTIP